VPPESLDLLQRRFWRLITAPDGVSAGLSDVASYDPGVAPVTSWIAAEDEETARERLDVYANMYFFRILDAVKSDVPRVAQLLGDDAFHDLTVDYLLAHPSTNASLRHAAAQLPAFLAGHNLAVGRPDLPDLARLELARNDVFHGPDSATLEAHTLSTISPEAWPQLRFRLVPTVRWLRLHTTTVPTWRALADGAPPPGPSTELSGCVVWRSRAPGAEDQVWHRATSLTEVAALDAVASGARFDGVCEILAADLPAPVADAGHPALQALVRWVGDGLLAGVARSPGGQRARSD
jgi:hypothetical protein